MMDDFDLASEHTEQFAETLLQAGCDPLAAADAMITTALALFGAHTGRQDTAREITFAWSAIRDGD